MAVPRSEIVAKLLSQGFNPQASTPLGGIGNIASIVIPLLLQQREGKAQTEADQGLIQSLLQGDTTPPTDNAVVNDPTTGVPTQVNTSLEGFSERNRGLPNSAEPSLQAAMAANPDLARQAFLKQMLAQLSPPPPVKGVIHNDTLINPFDGSTIKELPGAAEDPREFSRQNVEFPDGTRENIFIDKDNGQAFRVGPDGNANLSRPINTNFLEFNGLLQSSDLSDLSTDKKALRGFDSQIEDTQDIHFLADRIWELTNPLDPTGATIGLTQWLARAGQGTASQLNQLSRTFGAALEKQNPDADAQFGLLNPDSNIVFEAIKGTPIAEIAKSSTELRTILVNLAYIQAKAVNEGGRLSDADFAIQHLHAIAQDMGSVEQVRASVGEMVRFTTFRGKRAFNKRFPDKEFDLDRDFRMGRPPTFNAGSSSRRQPTDQIIPQDVAAQIQALAPQMQGMTDEQKIQFMRDNGIDIR